VANKSPTSKNMRQKQKSLQEAGFKDKLLKK
jgi:hypothetical protein